MSDGRRSFWSSIPGLITGLAGLLTGVVGLGTLAVQQGIVGGKDSATTTTAVVGAAPGSGPTTTVETASFTALPTPLQFQPTERAKQVTVKNTSRSAAITMAAPVLSGSDTSVFSVSADCSNVLLRASETCTVTVRYAPRGLLKQYNAKLSFEAKDVPRVAEVSIQTGAL